MAWDGRREITNLKSTYQFSNMLDILGKQFLHDDILLGFFLFQQLETVLQTFNFLCCKMRVISVRGVLSEVLSGHWW